MDFTYTPAEEAFRQEFRAWLEPNLCAHREQWGEDEDEFTQHPSSPASMAWHKRLYNGGCGLALAYRIWWARGNADGAGDFYRRKHASGSATRSQRDGHQHGRADAHALRYCRAKNTVSSQDPQCGRDLVSGLL